MFSQLRKHHIGIIIDPAEIPSLEKKYYKKFHVDKIQGTRVMFVEDRELGIYKGLIVQEGRAKSIPVGFYHVCYSVDNKNELGLEYIKNKNILDEYNGEGSDHDQFEFLNKNLSDNFLMISLIGSNLSGLSVHFIFHPVDEV